MAKFNFIIILVIACILNLSVCDRTNNNNNNINSQEESPLAGIAKEILKEKNMEHIGGMVNSFIQSGGAKQLMDGVLQNLGTDKNSELLESLGSLFANNEGEAKKQEMRENKESELNPMDLLSGLGSLVGAMQQSGGEQGAEKNSAALLQGLGSLLANANSDGGNNIGSILQGLGSLASGTNNNNNKENDESGNSAATLLQGLSSVIGAVANQNQNGADSTASILQGLGSLLSAGSQNDGNSAGGLNPELLGNLMNMFSQTGEAQKKPKNNKLKKASSSNEKKKLKKKASVKEDSPLGFDIGNLISMASMFLNQGKSKESNFMDYLPMIMNTINSFTGPEAQQRANSHSGHSWALPPAIEKIHVYFDSFINSEMGAKFTSYMENQKILKAFQNEKGEFDYDKFKELIENHSFRKHWLQRITEKIVNLLKFISDENIQKKYISMGITFTNSFLKNTGFPDNTLLDTKNPAKSITSFVNFAAKKYLDTEIQAKDYVEPTVFYIKDILKMAKNSLATKDLTDKLTDTINMEIIEPITRINRAYRFGKVQPTCDRYLFCILNQEDLDAYSSLPTVKKGLYKGYSLVAAWFLRLNTGTSYWDLYDAIIEQKNCQQYFRNECEGFKQEEIKVTTEYIHSEL